MTETEKKLFDYAVSVDWDYKSILRYIYSDEFNEEEYESLKGNDLYDKSDCFIEKYKPQKTE